MPVHLNKWLNRHTEIMRKAQEKVGRERLPEKSITGGNENPISGPRYI